MYGIFILVVKSPQPGKTFKIFTLNFAKSVQKYIYRWWMVYFCYASSIDSLSYKVQICANVKLKLAYWSFSFYKH